MSKKTLTIISDELGKMHSYNKQLKLLFRDNVIIKELYYTKSTPLNEEDLKFDVGLICSGTLWTMFTPLVRDNSNLIMFKRTISKSCYEKLRKLPSDKNIGVIAGDDEMETILITKLYTAGLIHLNFYPYNKLVSRDFIDDIVIFDDEENIDNYPIKHKNTIFVGQSMLDITTIVDIATKLDMEDVIFNQDIESSSLGFKSTDIGFSNILDKAKLSDCYIDSISKMVNKGIIGIDSSGNIKTYNKEAVNIFKMPSFSVLNKNVYDLFPFIPFKESLEKQETLQNILVTYNDANIIISVGPVYHSGKVYGAIATVMKYTDSEEEQNKIRAKIMGKGHVAKYTFNDIIGASEEIIKCKKIARNMAKSSSSVLITGESGTGKELFAQSIHNSSPRKNAPFVAINCGAFPENLLESELFGYEEGAFTGARKGGKQGLLELAHTGTLFLDEIAEMPMHLQLKLLRVLQEREFMRIGSDQIINIDIKIIASTNKDLKELIENNEFREDLYYRLNVLPLHIPPLRERKEDIMTIFNYMKNNYDGKFELTPKAQSKLESYNWKGNIRELQNIVEYLCNINNKIIDYNDIPIKECSKKQLIELNPRDKELIEKLFILADGNIDKYVFVLSELKNTQNKTGLGRRKIYQDAIDNGIYISENEIRKILLDLEDFTMINVKKGRGGSNITEFGYKTLNYLEKVV